MTVGTLGHMIAGARGAAGLSQARLAGRLGVRQPSVSEWESGRSVPSVPMLHALPVELDLDPGGLLAAAAAAVREGEPP